jgi:phosphatidate cytidylyltransferase
MTAFWSRILVALAGLPAVLGIVWLGGWWLVLLVLGAGLLALHEYFTITRRLRPLVLAGYVGATLALIGVHLGGELWMLGGLLATLPLAFVLHGLSATRGSATVSIGSTFLGSTWIGLGLAYIVLLRAIPDHGRLAAFTVLIAVWASDTAAYFVGRLIGRHKLAPALSPGKTVEGFVAGTVTAMFVAFIALYRTGFVDGWRSVLLGFGIAVSAVLGDLFESAIKRDMEVKDSGRILAGHGGMLDRIDALLFAGVASFYLIAALGGT